MIIRNDIKNHKDGKVMQIVLIIKTFHIYDNGTNITNCKKFLFIFLEGGQVQCGSISWFQGMEMAIVK